MSYQVEVQSARDGAWKLALRKGLFEDKIEAISEARSRWQAIQGLKIPGIISGYRVIDRETEKVVALFNERTSPSQEEQANDIVSEIEMMLP